MSPELLFEPPFTDNAPKGVGSVFDGDQSRALIAIIKLLNDSADVAG
jgi:type I restriction enzyme, R subunit